jgi:hypothetical protein
MQTRAATYDYKNKFVLNQRGGTIVINNSTNREQVKISQHSGSNISISNFVNSELATNNKQTKVANDEFRTIGHSLNTSIGQERTVHVGENSYEFIGYNPDLTGRQIGVHYRWREDYRQVASWNSEFDVFRGGYSKPNGITTPQVGSRATNPDLKFNAKALVNTTSKVTPTPLRKSNLDQVWRYTNVANRNQPSAQSVVPSVGDVSQAFGKFGTNAPGILQFGASVSSATEGGSWVLNKQKNVKIIAEVVNNLYLPVEDPGDLVELPPKKLLPLEARMGKNGDSILSVKRHKVECIGVMTNNYPSVRIDDYGRSQPTEVGVSGTRLIKHHDYVPHVEDISNDENFPCGNYTLTVGNKYNVMVGSGGIQVNTTGAMTLGCTSLRAACTRVDLNASHGIVLGSASHIDIYSPKIHLRSRRQVLVDTSLGVTNNATVGGGLYVEGELFTHHVTAPLEIQQTENTECWGYLPWDTKKICGWAQMKTTTVIGRVSITVYYFNGLTNVPLTYTRNVYGSGAYVPVYGSNVHDTVRLYPHSHHFHNLPLRLTETNKALRNRAANEGINIASFANRALKMDHRRKTAWKDPGPRTE